MTKENGKEYEKQCILHIAYKKYKAISTKLDLCNNSLTYCDFQNMFYIFKDLFYEGRSECISESAAKWFRNMGFNITDGNVDYFISL